MRRIIIFSLVLSFAMLRPSATEAAINPKQQISIILFSGLGGAVLGLSTLSFYSQPQDHLRNIAVGGAIALIGSVVFTTVYAAKQSKAETESSAMEAESKGVDKGGAVKPKEKKKKDATGRTKDEQEEEEPAEPDATEEGAMLDGVRVKVLAADYGRSGVRFDPWFLYINSTSMNQYGAKEISVYGRVLEINF